MTFKPPANNCSNCKRLCAFRADNRQKFPTYYNAPVPSFGNLDAEILIVGLAPGLNGANQTGRPFTNDYAGDILYPALKANHLANGNYQKKSDDGFELINVRVTNAVRCVPPQNKPTPEEEKNCRQFLAAEISSMPNLKVILSLGGISHKNVLQALNLKQSVAKFTHGAVHLLPEYKFKLIDSYHTSRYNINTGVLTAAMFDEIIKKTKGLIKNV
ncbi:MAG: uracil-DNA glycosylase [Alphaproteobacteria bacterium]|nr:uracil-DNA glycosylase [Alphaproteobacteria bacterium]